MQSFNSQCGGVPADPRVNPLGYKVSWSPAGVVAAARNGARYLEHGAIQEISAEEVFSTAARVQLPGLPELEAFYNRDSVAYAETYGVRDEVAQFARMTLRYPGWCETFSALTALGALSDDLLPAGVPAHEILGVAAGTDAPRRAVAERLGAGKAGAVLDRLEWLGLFSRNPVTAAQGKADALVALMAARMQYNAREMDRIILRHELHAAYGDGRSEVEMALLVLDGAPRGFSAMSRTVGVPAAVAATLLAEGRVGITGVQIPTTPALYEPILQVLASEQLVPSVTKLCKRL